MTSGFGRASQRCIDTEFDVEHSTIQFEPVAHADHEHETHP